MQRIQHRNKVIRDILKRLMDFFLQMEKIDPFNSHYTDVILNMYLY